MVESIEVEVTDSVKEMLDTLRERHGDTIVAADLSDAVQQSVRQGYQQLSEEDR